MTLVVATAASGVARTAHFTLPTGASTPIQTLLIEGQATNRVLQSQTLADAAWVATNVTVTANNANAPDGTATADTLDATSAGGSLVQAVTFTGATGTRPISVFLKAGTAAVTDLEVYDVTAATSRRVVRVTWTAGVPAVTSVSGTGTIHPVMSFANDWYRIAFQANGIVAGAGRNEVRIFPGGTAGTGTVIAWGVQGEDGAVASAPSQYIATVGSAVTRNADVLWFPFTAPPQVMTIYTRFVERGTVLSAAAFRALQVGGSATPCIRIGSGVVSTSAYNVQNAASSGSPSSSNSTTGASPQPTLNDLVELRIVIGATGAARIHMAINGGAEVSGAQGAALGTPYAALSESRIYVGSDGAGSGGLNAFTHIIIAAGEQSMATMRTLAGVA